MKTIILLLISTGCFSQANAQNTVIVRLKYADTVNGKLRELNYYKDGYCNSCSPYATSIQYNWFEHDTINNTYLKIFIDSITGVITKTNPPEYLSHYIIYQPFIRPGKAVIIY